MTVPGNVNREICVALKNVRPEIVKAGLTKMLQMSIDQFEENISGTQFENMENRKVTNIVNLVNPINGSDGAGFSSESNITPLVGDRVLVFWPDEK